jgi:hypothetical protein
MEEHRLRVFQNRVLRKTIGTNRKDLTGKCKKFHDIQGR